MAPPSEATPMAPLQWIILCRAPRTSLNLPKGADISLALDAPPRTSQLVVSPTVVASAILAADPSGVVLLSGCDPLAASGSASNDLWDAVFKTSRHVPAPETPANGTAVAGLVVIRGRFDQYHMMIAELSVCKSVATLRCFLTETSKWTHKNLRPPRINQWCSTYAISYKGRLWWVDLVQGLLACDPFADSPELHFVPLPNCYQLLARRIDEGRRKSLSNDRCVSLSCGKLRLVVINRRTPEPRIKVWTLADYEAGKWSLDFEIPIQHIWGHRSHGNIGLPMERLVVAFVHPSNAHVVYCFLEQQLLAVDLQTKKVIESASVGRDYGNHVLAWELPPSLRMASSGPPPTQESRSTFDFDSVADSFCEAYDHALFDMESHWLSKIALAYLNRKKKAKDNMFKLSDPLFLQTFVEDNNTTMKKYAHLNFYADTGSKKVLVFAEFRTDAVADEERNDWALLSCKILTRNYLGGLYGEDVDERRSREARKRKKSIYCFACAAEMLHPISGFEGGYAGISA